MGGTGLLLVALLSATAARDPGISGSSYRIDNSVDFLYRKGNLDALYGVDGEDETDSVKRIKREQMLQTCTSCHEVNEKGYVGENPDHPLNRRVDMEREFWKSDLNLSVKCGSCHTLVEPESIPQRRWKDVLYHMRSVVNDRNWPVTYEREEWIDILHYYVSGSENFDDIPPDPSPSGLRFTARQIGDPFTPSLPPRIGNVEITDLDCNGEPDILATDFQTGMLSWLYRHDTTWKELPLVRSTVPARGRPFDFNNDGHPDILLSDIGNQYPTDSLVGRVLLLINDGTLHFSVDTILDGVGRVSDARPADLDNDGDLDVLVAVFGFINTGGIGWLEQKEGGEFAYHPIIKKAGGIDVIPVHLNDDDLIDFIGLVAQEHEEIIGFVNQGNGKFKQHMIYKAFTPAYGFSGIELVDLDSDGDLDILATNGDAFDLPRVLILPYHGIQWLENKGDLVYEPHHLMSYYGAYRALPGDLDNDGDTDILAISLFNDWANPQRMSVVWLENDGALNFTPRGIGADVSSLISADIGDIDMDGDLDFVTAGMHVIPDPFKRFGRVTLWLNGLIVE